MRSSIRLSDCRWLDWRNVRKAAQAMVVLSTLSVACFGFSSVVYGVPPSSGQGDYVDSDSGAHVIYPEGGNWLPDWLAPTVGVVIVVCGCVLAYLAFLVARTKRLARNELNEMRKLHERRVESLEKDLAEARQKAKTQEQEDEMMSIEEVIRDYESNSLKVMNAPIDMETKEDHLNDLYETLNNRITEAMR